MTPNQYERTRGNLGRTLSVAATSMLVDDGLAAA
jgi:hypothetical protein